LGGYGGRKFLGVREVGKFGRLERPQDLGGWEVRKFGMSGGLELLGGRKDRQDPVAGNKYIFATSCRLCKYDSGDYRTQKALSTALTLFFVLFQYILI
jgi:hypothetical protein